MCSLARAAPCRWLAPELSAQLAARRADACHATTSAHLLRGTTGCQGARLNHIRFFSAAIIPYMFRLRATDRIYCCLPMCHTAAVGSLSVAGGSAHRSYSLKVLSLQLLAGMCGEPSDGGAVCWRALPLPRPHAALAARRSVQCASPSQRVAARRVAQVCASFGVEQIAEVYASTEATPTLPTLSKEGAVGFVSPLLARMFVRLVKLREKDGQGEGGGEGEGATASRCVTRQRPVRAVPPRRGWRAAWASRPERRGSSFAGYTDTSATRKRLVRDVLRRAIAGSARAI